MNKIPYQRRKGDFEIRILKDGRVVMITPDESLLKIAQAIEMKNSGLSNKTEAKENAGKSAE